MTQYRPVPPQVDLPTLERGVLQFWREHQIFEKSIARNQGGHEEAQEPGPGWTFYEGPPTANGRPGTHHVEARTFKDVFPRFRTMQGYQVNRKGGWDCHGLPVELAVEKELGFSGKADIEAFGVAEFNEHCRESVQRHVDLWEEMTERMGCWIDMRQPYRTMDPEYVESVWWALQQIHRKGLLVEDYRVSPYCPRDGTALSDHEVAQGYETVTDPSVYVRFPLTSGPYAGTADAPGASLLVWTTTPWTLVSNTAVAVRADVTYAVATDGNETLVVAEPLVGSALGEGWTVEATLPGSEMERWTYQRPFELVEFPPVEEGGTAPHLVLLADYVTTEDGTGLVHQSPAFGQEDMTACRAYGLPVVVPVQPDGHFADDIALVGGQFFKHADAALVADLDSRGLLFRHVPYEHSYPHCWRCHTPLMYYALPSWYIRTTEIKDAMVRENEATNWFPDTIKHGRYGDWLENNIDWALSRSRYWGTPLPIWRCEQGHQTCIGSLKELGELTGTDQSGLDPHRPYVDEVTFPCPDEGCGQQARRVPEVIDAWFDSGSMPFAQWGYPHREGSAEMLERAYPADFICEAIDQTRGWFYTLMAVGTLVFDESSYRNVLCLGHIMAEDGRKMSKHLGNILEPIPLMDEHGADAVRWFMAAGGSPWAARRVGHNTIQETVRKVLLTYWNTVAFQALYARTSGWSPGDAAPELAERPVLDRWALSEAHRLALSVTEAFESFDTQRAGALLSAYVDDLSNWYVRRSRRRFWNGDPAALATLHECLYVVTLCMAPLTPFITERVWQDMFASTSTELPGVGAPGRLAPRGREPRRRLADDPGAAGPAAGGARTRGACRGEGEDPSTTATRAGRLGRPRPALRGAAPRGGRRAQRRRRRAAVGGGRRPRGPQRQGQLQGAGQAVRQGHPTGGRGDRGGRRGSPGRGPRGPGTRRGRAGRCAGGGARRGGAALRAAAGGLVGGQRAGRDDRARPRAHRGAAPGRAGPRGDPVGPGGAEERRLRRLRPDHPDLARRR